MNYINKFLIGIAVVLTLPIIGCGDGSEDLVPSEQEKNLFAVDPEDKSRDAELRREFYDNTGIYLLYTDLLGTYKDNFGNDREERVDFNWGLNTNNSKQIRFEELTDSEKEETTRLMSTYFVPYINVENGKVRPYSILLVKDLGTKGEYDYNFKSQEFYSCFRCFCVNVENWIGADDEEAKALGKTLLKSLVDTKIDYNNEGLDPFFSICDGLHEERIADFIPEWIDEQNVEWIYEKGFMSYYQDYWDEVEYDEFRSRKIDLRDFMNALFNEDEAAFKETWSDYPLIIQRYDILKECVEAIGIDFNAVK